MRSGQAADFDGGVLVGAGECRLAGGFEDEPGDAEGLELGEAESVGFRFEVGLGGLADGPGLGERGSDGGFASVFRVVGECAALGEGAEALGVFVAAFGDVVGVEGEEGVDRGVGANPEEGLLPGVVRRGVRPLDVRGVGEGGALGDEHGGCEGEKEDGPSPAAIFEDLGAEPCAEQQDHELVDDLEGAEGLQARDEVGGGGFVREEQRDEEGDGAEEDGGVGEEAVFRCGAFAQSEEDEQRGDEAEELVPAPLGEEPVVAGEGDLDVDGGFGWGFGLKECGQDEGEGCEGERRPEFARLQGNEAGYGGEGVAGHQRVEDCGEEEGYGAEDGFAPDKIQGSFAALRMTRVLGKRKGLQGVDGEGEGEQGEGRGEAAGGEVRVHQHEGGAGDGEGEPACEEGDRGESCLRIAREPGCEEPGGVQGEPDAAEVEDEQRPVEREVRSADEGGDQRGEERKAQMLGDEVGPGGEKGGVEEFFDAGGVDPSVFDEGVVAGDQEGEDGEQGDGEQAGFG